jgi:transcriptional regulator
MYVPRHFAETDRDELYAHMRASGFATLVSVCEGALFATHVPLLLDPARGPLGTLVGHVARANPHAHSLAVRAPALAIFHGPHAYVSPRWLRGEAAVPTWNYTAVHATGTPRVLDDARAVRELLERMAETYEAAAAEPWNLDRLPARAAEALQRAIVAFELPIERLEGKRKLSQNKSPADRLGVIEGLRAEGDAASVAVAEAMSVS